MTEKHRGACGRIGDVDHRYVEQFLQAFAAVFAVAGLNHRIERLVVGHDPVHHRNGGQVAFEVAFDRVGTEVGRQANDLRAGRGHGLGRAGDRLGDGFGGVDVDHENAHGKSL
ncbi:hypothetical protein D3C73_1318080 [compost metagenome]